MHYNQGSLFDPDHSNGKQGLQNFPLHTVLPLCTSALIQFSFFERIFLVISTSGCICFCSGQNNWARNKPISVLKPEFDVLPCSISIHIYYTAPLVMQVGNLSTPHIVCNKCALIVGFAFAVGLIIRRETSRFHFWNQNWVYFHPLF